jgi:hypothetical protein
MRDPYAHLTDEQLRKRVQQRIAYLEPRVHRLASLVDERRANGEEPAGWILYTLAETRDAIRFGKGVLGDA